MVPELSNVVGASSAMALPASTMPSVIPINIFLSKEIFEFRYAIKHFSTKDVKVVLGPCTSLNDIIVKRIKRKSITLVRKVS
jgi:hypothetical protein